MKRCIIIFLTSILLSQFLGAAEANSIADYEQQVAQYEAIGDNMRLAEVLNKLGYEYWDGGKLESALSCFERSIAVNQKLGNQNAILNLHTNMGMILSDQNQLESALLSFKKSLVIRKALGEKQLIVTGLLNIASTLQKLQRFYDSNKQADEALEIAKQLNDMRMLRKCYGLYAENYEKLGDTQKSMEYFTLYATFDRNIQKKETERKVAESEAIASQAQAQASSAQNKIAQAQQVQKVQEARLEQASHKLKETKKLTEQQKLELHYKELELKQSESELARKKTIQLFFIIALAFAGLIAFIIFRSYRAKKRLSEKLEVQNAEIVAQQEIIKKKNQDITKSINYAQKIQSAMLPTYENLLEYLPESFIMFRPRDVVSGDFYWFAPVDLQSFVKEGELPQRNSNEKQKTDILISAVDCTGHGVPGAFMSMIGFNLLDEIVSSGINSPGKILDNLHLGITNTLKQDVTENRDGMDLVVCRICRKANKVVVAGAKNSAIYIKDGELQEIHGHKYPIGGQKLKSRTPYPETEVLIDSPTWFYIFSDGYQDQFGGPDDKKFLSKRLYDLLLSIHQKPMAEQSQILESSIVEWMGGQRQIDDMLIVGFKIEPKG